MPIITGLQTTLIRDVNTGLATTLFPRFMQTFFGKICGSTLSTALVEPFAFDGASPLLRRFNGSMDSSLVNSFSLQVPNPLFKNYEEIMRTTYEMDQTGTVRKRAAAIGIRVAQGPDYLLAKRILAGDSETTNFFADNATTYNSTFDGVAQYSGSHVLGKQSAQSNIITGSLPATAALLKAQDIAITVNQLHRDLEAIIDLISSLVDDKGAQIFPDFDPEKHLQLVVPPILRPAARLAFQTPGTVAGSGGTGGSSGSTTNIGPSLVNEVVSPGLLRGCIDIEVDPQTTITPTNPTQYYWNIKDDYVKPFYFQRFRPKKGSEFIPAGYDPEAAADAALAAASKLGSDVPKLSVEAADLYAMTTIDTNVGAIGASAQAEVVRQEKFFMSGRTRFNIFYGPWFLTGKVDPVGTSN